MQRTRLISSLLLLVALILSFVGPALADGGSVTIPLEEFIKLRQGNGGSGALVPVPYIYSKGQYRATARARRIEVEGVVSLRIYQSGWVEIPLLSTDAVLSDAQIDGTPLPVFQKEQAYRFVARGEGVHTVKLRYNLPLNNSQATRTFIFRIPDTSVSNLSLTIPESSVRIQTSPVLPFTSHTVGSTTVMEASVPAGGEEREVTLSWLPVVANSALHGKVNREKARIEARIYTLATVAEKEVKWKSQILYSILRNEVSQLAVAVPDGTEVLDLQCPHLSGYKVVDEQGGRVIHIALSEPVSGNHLLTLTLTHPIDRINSTWDVPTVEVLEAERVKGSVGIEATGGIEVTPVEQREARQIDVKELPLEVTQMSTSPVLLAFEYHKQPYRLAVDTRKGDEIPVLTATIDTAQGLTLLTPDGKAVSTFTYNVRNNLKQNITLSIPDGATIWSAYVNGEPVKPIKGKDGRVSLPLLRSQGSGNMMATFPAEITFVWEGNKARWFGQQQLLAPEVDIPISQFNWSLYMPADRKVLSFGGTMEAGGAMDVSGTIVAPESTSAGIGSAASMANSPREAPAGQANGKTVDEETDRAEGFKKDGDKEASRDQRQLANMINQTRVGAFPVRVFVPQIGDLHRFSKLMVAREVPTIQFTYYSSGLQKAAAWALLVLVVVVGLQFVRRMAGWKAMAVLGVATLLLDSQLSGSPFGPLVRALYGSLTILAAFWVAWNGRALLDAFGVWKNRTTHGGQPAPQS